VQAAEARLTEVQTSVQQNEATLTRLRAQIAEAERRLLQPTAPATGSN
jgi:predicted  nucleic acid-binding Zn-ribbon protein